MNRLLIREFLLLLFILLVGNFPIQIPLPEIPKAGALEGSFLPFTHALEEKPGYQ